MLPLAGELRGGAPHRHRHLPFTDIEGSTRLLRELRDDYATALADHQRIIREALAAHDRSGSLRVA